MQFDYEAEIFDDNEIKCDNISDEIFRIEDIINKMDNDVVILWYDVIDKYINSFKCQILDKLYKMGPTKFRIFMLKNSPCYIQLNNYLDHLYKLKKE